MFSVCGPEYKGYDQAQCYKAEDAPEGTRFARPKSTVVHAMDI